MTTQAAPSSAPSAVMPGWQWSFAAVFASQFIAVLGFSMFVPFLPLYLGELGIGSTGEQALWSGVIFGITPLLSGLASPFWGALGDKFGPKAMLVRAQLLGGISIGLMAFAPNAVWLLGFRIVQGLVGGNMGPAVALGAAVSPAARLGTMLGIMQMSVYAGASVGPLVGGMLADAVGYRLAFVFTAACQVVSALLVILLVRHSGRVETRRVEQTVLGDVRVLLTTPALLSVVVVAFGVYFANGALQSVLSLFVESLHEGGSVAFTVGMIFGVSAVASALSSVASGRLSDAVGHRTVLVVSLVGAALASAPLAFATSSVHVLIGRFVMGLFVGGALPLVNVLAARIGGPERRAGAIGVAQMAGSLGLASGPLAGAAVAATVWLGAPFLLIAAVLGIGAAWAFVALKPRAEQDG